MLALKNNNKLAGNNGKPLVNAEITSLQVVNTNAFQFKMITTGPIRVYWGDGTYTDVPTKSTYYTITKTYSVVGTYNIVIANPENVTALYFQNGSPWWGERINTNVSWFKQFYNLTRLELSNAAFIGDLALILEQNSNLTSLNYGYNFSSTCTLNVSNCKKFWNRALYVYVNTSYNLSGSITDIYINVNCTCIYLHISQLYGNSDGIVKNGYTQLNTFYLYCQRITSHNNFTNLQDWILPDTLITISYFRTYTFWGIMDNFNFSPNLLNFTSEYGYTSLNLTNNISFNNVLKTKLDQVIIFYMGVTPVTINLNECTKASYSNFRIMADANYNLCYGDLTQLVAHTKYVFSMMGGKGDNAIYGTIDTTFKGISLMLSRISATITSVSLIMLALQSDLYLDELPNVTGDISNIVFSKLNASGLVVTNMMNLYGDLTTFIYGAWYNTVNVSTYRGIYLFNNPHFTGNLGNLTLWSNKSNIYLQNCAYTNIGGFVNNVFTNRNTCLKAAGGVTYINVANNVDNNLLTGVLQRGSLGTYTGNQNDLTEAQIDNLANGLDYTGTGTSTPWTHKEKIWCELNWKNSSTDNSSRYRLGSFTV